MVSLLTTAVGIGRCFTAVSFPCSHNSHFQAVIHHWNTGARQAKLSTQGSDHYTSFLTPHSLPDFSSFCFFPFHFSDTCFWSFFLFLKVFWVFLFGFLFFVLFWIFPWPLHPIWGLTSRSWDRESHAPLLSQPSTPGSSFLNRHAPNKSGQNN